MNILSFGKKGSESDDIGGFTPLIVMHEERKQEVVESNQEVNKTLQRAIKKLIRESE